MMKKLFLTSMVSLIAISSAAFAGGEAGKAVAGDDSDVESQAPAACAMSFEAKGGGLQILVGDFELKGEGVIKCVDYHGVETRMPVNVQLGGRSPIALKLAAGKLAIAGVATGLGWARTPEDVTGKYLAVEADGAFILGAGATAAARLARHDAATIDVALKVEHGLGFDVGFNSLTITPKE